MPKAIINDSDGDDGVYLIYFSMMILLKHNRGFHPEMLTILDGYNFSFYD